MLSKTDLMDDILATPLLLCASEGQLLRWLVAAERSEEERRHAYACLAGLHSARRLNLFEHLDARSRDGNCQPDYGTMCRVYRELIPLIDDEAGTVVTAISCLAVGYMEYPCYEALLDWCTLNAKRIDEVLALECRPELSDFCFAAALIAALRTDPAAYIDIAVDFARGNRRSRSAGVLALAAMSVQEDALVRRAMQTLGAILDDEHAPLESRAGAVTAAVELAQRCDGFIDRPVADMIRSATAYRRVEFLDVCCSLLVRFGRQLRESLFQPLLTALGAVEIDGTARSPADLPLYTLLTNGRKDEAIACLEVLIRKSNAKIPLNSFQSTSHCLAAGTTDLLPQVICRWLLTGERALCAAARHLLISAGDQKLAFDFDPGNRDWSDRRTLYLARKAIGWLMPHGTAPASFLVCLLRNASEEAGQELVQLLLDPLLVNYPIATGTYLETVCPNLPTAAKARVEAVLHYFKLYQKGIEEVGFVPELQPLERQRWVAAKRQAEQWTKAKRDAERQSVLLQMVTRRTILYGTRTVCYAADPGGGSRRLENRLHTFSHTADNTMGLIYDPLGIDFQLRLFRAERRPE